MDSTSAPVMYIGRMAATDSEEMSVSMLTMPRAMTVGEALNST